MIRAYTVLNLLLGIVAVGATGLVLIGREPVRQITNEKSATESVEQAAVEGISDSQPLRTSTGVVQDVETLWENTIFNPKRREGIELTAAPSVSEEERTVPANMELMAVGMVGARAAAVIVVEDPQSRQIDVRRRGRQTARDRTQHVYNLGEVVEGTGYTITEIKMEEVILSRGDEERVLRLTPANEASRQRREAAVRQEGEARRQDERRRAVREIETRLDPPPVPAAGSEEERSEDEEMSRDEQIRRVIERRREAIEELRRRQREQ